MREHTEIRAEVDGHVGLVTIDRPEARHGLRRALDPDWSELGRRVSTSLGELFSTEDHREGVASFLEKRGPRYVGR